MHNTIFQGALDQSGLRESLLQIVKGDCPIADAARLGDICVLCANCIFGAFQQ